MSGSFLVREPTRCIARPMTRITKQLAKVAYRSRSFTRAIASIGSPRACPRQAMDAGVNALWKRRWWNERDLNPHLPLGKAPPIELSPHQEWCLELVSSQPLRVFGAALSPDQLPRLVVVNWRGRGESNSFRRSGAPALNQSTTAALMSLRWKAKAIGAPPRI